MVTVTAHSESSYQYYTSISAFVSRVVIWPLALAIRISACIPRACYVFNPTNTSYCSWEQRNPWISFHQLNSLRIPYIIASTCVLKYLQSFIFRRKRTVFCLSLIRMGLRIITAFRSATMQILYLVAYRITVLCVSGCIWYVNTVAICMYTANASEEREVKRVARFMSHDRSFASCCNTARLFPMSDEAILSLKCEVEIKAHTANYQRM